MIMCLFYLVIYRTSYIQSSSSGRRWKRDNSSSCSQ